MIRLREGAGGRAYWDAQWRYRTAPGDPWRLKKRRLGLAWQEPDGSGGWRKRKGRSPEGWLDERSANVAAVAAMQEHAHELADEECRRREAAERKVTVRELAHEWLSWLEQVKGAKPATIADYRWLLREAGERYRRRAGVSHGRVMAALGDRKAADVSTADVTRFLRSLDAYGLTPRSVNKHRQVVAAMFNYGCRSDTLNLAFNPAAGTDKRREDPPAALDYYELEDVEALARACERSEHRHGSRRSIPASSPRGSGRTAGTPTPSGCCSTPACDSARCLRSAGRTSTSLTASCSSAAGCRLARRPCRRAARTDSYRYPPRRSRPWHASRPAKNSPSPMITFCATAWADASIRQR